MATFDNLTRRYRRVVREQDEMSHRISSGAIELEEGLKALRVLDRKRDRIMDRQVKLARRPGRARAKGG